MDLVHLLHSLAVSVCWVTDVGGKPSSSDLCPPDDTGVACEWEETWSMCYFLDEPGASCVEVRCICFAHRATACGFSNRAAGDQQPRHEMKELTWCLETAFDFYVFMEWWHSSATELYRYHVINVEFHIQVCLLVCAHGVNLSKAYLIYMTWHVRLWSSAMLLFNYERGYK